MVNEWLDRMYALAQKDAHCQQMLRDVQALETSYSWILQKLEKADAATVDQYITACEEQNYSLIFSAYEIGRQDGFAAGLTSVLNPENGR